jgi:hypothetical protein
MYLQAEAKQNQMNTIQPARKTRLPGFNMLVQSSLHKRLARNYGDRTLAKSARRSSGMLVARHHDLISAAKYPAKKRHKIRGF